MLLAWFLKLVKDSYFLCLSVRLDAQPRIRRPSIGFLREFVPNVYHLYLLIWGIVAHGRHGNQSGKRSFLTIKVTNHFPCTSANVIYCVTCTLRKKLYISETGRPLGDLFRDHLRDVEKDSKNSSKPVARHLNLPNHSKQHMAVCGLSLHQGSMESRKTLEQKFIFQIGTLNPQSINEFIVN